MKPARHVFFLLCLAHQGQEGHEGCHHEDHEGQVSFEGLPVVMVSCETHPCEELAVAICVRRLP